MAPAWSLPDELRAQLHKYAVDLTSKAKYKNAGTVEFLVDKENRPYFIEVNPRIQVSSFVLYVCFRGHKIIIFSFTKYTTMQNI